MIRPTSRLVALPLALCLCASAGLAQDSWGELMGLGQQARATWPALAELVEQAKHPAQDQGLREARYGRRTPNRAQRSRDWEALGEALDALQVLEHSAEGSHRFQAAQRQLLSALRVGLGEATPERSKVPEVSEPWITGRSWAETLAKVERGQGRSRGALRPVLLLLHELRQATVPSRPGLSDAELGSSLSAAGRAQAYAIAGLANETQYTGHATISFHDGQLTVYRTVGGSHLRAELSSDGEGGWSFSGLQLARGGLTALGGDDSGASMLQGRIRQAARGELLASWERLSPDGERLNSGSERLTATGRTGSQVPAVLGMSPLMAKVVAAAMPCAEKGTVPRDLMLTTRNTTNKRALLEGPEIFAAYAELLQTANQEVLVQSLVWENDSEAAARMLAGLRALESRTQRGAPVRVRFMRSEHVFALGGLKAVRQMREQLEGAGLDPQRVDLKVRGYRHGALDNLHGKDVIVDGQHAILTGANFEVCHDAGEPWFDAGFGVSGEVVRALRADYVEGWHRATGEWLPPLTVPHQEGAIPMLLATSKGRGSPFTNATDDPQAAAFATAIREAKQLVRIHTPNLNDDLIKDAIVSAVLNGVRVEGVVSHTFNEPGESLPGRGGGNAKNVRELYARVAEAGGEAAVGRLDMRWYSAPNGEVVIGNGPRASHAKYATFDHHVAIVGSGNLDTTSINNSREVNVVIDDEATVRAWDGRLFEPNFARAGSARPVVPDRALGQ